MMAFVFMLAAAAYTAPVAACDATAVPQIQVNVPAPYFNIEKASGTYIATLTRDNSGHQVSGVTLYDPQPHIDLLLNKSIGLFESCLSVASINVTLADPNPRILVASEFPRGSCIEARLIEHENKHGAAYRQAYARFSSLASAALAAAFNGYNRSAAIGSEAAIQQQIYNRAEQIVTPLISQVDADAWAQHMLIDSAQEYDAIRASCNGEFDRYLN